MVRGRPALRDVLLWGLVPCSGPVATARSRCTSWEGRDVQPPLRLPLLLLGNGTSAAATLAKVFGWAFAGWGIGLYWWAGVLYAYQV